MEYYFALLTQRCHFKFVLRFPLSDIHSSEADFMVSHAAVYCVFHKILLFLIMSRSPEERRTEVNKTRGPACVEVKLTC